MITELKCPLCKTPKRKMSKEEYDRMLSELNKTWDELTLSMQGLFKISKYTFDCNCPENKVYELDNARKNINKEV
jgi:hypothetical protein